MGDDIWRMLANLRRKESSDSRGTRSKAAGDCVTPWGILVDDRDADIQRLLEYKGRIPRDSMVEVVRRSQMRCEMCSMSLQKKPYRIHHLDGDSTSFEPDNMMLICPHCYAHVSQGEGV